MKKTITYQKVLSSYDLKCQLSKDVTTTNLKSQTDVIFSNAHPIKVGTQESYFSYHKTIYAILNLQTSKKLSN